MIREVKKELEKIIKEKNDIHTEHKAFVEKQKKYIEEIKQINDKLL